MAIQYKSIKKKTQKALSVQMNGQTAKFILVHLSQHQVKGYNDPLVTQYTYLKTK